MIGSITARYSAGKGDVKSFTNNNLDKFDVCNKTWGEIFAVGLITRRPASPLKSSLGQRYMSKRKVLPECGEPPNYRPAL
jgi:hypothetical protein